MQAKSQQEVISAQQAAGRVAASQGAVELDPQTGNPIVDPVTGTAKINLPKYQYGLFKAGLGTEALQAEATVLANTMNAQKATGGAVDLNNSVRNFLATAGKAAYDSTDGTPAQKTAAAATVWNGLAQKAVQASNQPGQVALDPHQLEYSPGSEHVLYTAQISPGNQESLKIAQGNLQLGWAGNQLATKQFENGRLTTFTDPASQDPNSPASQRARDIIKNTLGEDLPQDMSASSIYNNPKYQPSLTSVGSNVGTARIQASQDLNKWQSFDDTVNKARSQLSSLGYTPAQFVSNWASGKVANTPELAALAGQMALLPPGVVNSAQSWDAMHATNQAMIDQANRNLKSATGGSGTGIVPGSGTSPTVTPGQPQAQPQAPLVKPNPVDKFGAQRADAARAIQLGAPKDAVAARFKKLTGQDY